MFATHTRVLAELERRVARFPREIDRLEAAVAADVDGLGLHRRQVSVLKILMDVLLQQQRDHLAGLGGDLTDARFADEVRKLLSEEMPGAQRVWSVFSRAFAARREPELARQLDTADLVAAECYQLAMRQAQNWGVIDEVREPPLVCPEASPEPFALGRQELLGSLGPFRGVGWRFYDLRLPLPLVMFPPDQLGCVWLLPVLCHEVGHDVDTDLALTAEIARALADGAAIPPERRAAWRRWGTEIVADALGALLGNAGFAGALAELLLVLAPGPFYQALDLTDAYPHPILRVLLLAAMLRRLGVPALADTAARLEAGARTPPAPEGLAPFLGDVDAVAAVILDSKLGALGGHALAELNPGVAADVKQAGILADFLARGELRPSPDRPSPYPVRLVPVAAQLALAEAGPGPAPFDAVQQRADDFVAAIPRPPFLDGGARLSPRRAAYVAELARRVDFGRGG